MSIVFGGCSNQQNTDTDTSAMLDAYVSALRNLLDNQTLPDGTKHDFHSSMSMADNKFAVSDVDQDGKDELVILYTTTTSAGMTGLVFSYDEETKTLHTELSEYPSLTFYDNGMIKADWSHNQGLGGEFWPYNLYEHDPETNSYQLIGMVDAWERKLSEKDAQGNPFPSEIDRSGSGYVYYIMTDGTYDATHPVGEYEYREWIKERTGDAKELQIRFQDLTEETIARITIG